MIYCKECVKTTFCNDSRKSHSISVACHKYKDKNYKNYSRDRDCDSVTLGAFGAPGKTIEGNDRNRESRDVERIAQNMPNLAGEVIGEV